MSKWEYFLSRFKDRQEQAAEYLNDFTTRNNLLGFEVHEMIKHGMVVAYPVAFVPGVGITSRLDWAQGVDRETALQALVVLRATEPKLTIGMSPLYGTDLDGHILDEMDKLDMSAFVIKSQKK